MCVCSSHSVYRECPYCANSVTQTKCKQKKASEIQIHSEASWNVPFGYDAEILWQERLCRNSNYIADRTSYLFKSHWQVTPVTTLGDFSSLIFMLDCSKYGKRWNFTQQIFSGDFSSRFCTFSLLSCLKKKNTISLLPSCANDCKRPVEYPQWKQQRSF